MKNERLDDFERKVVEYRPVFVSLQPSSPEHAAVHSASPSRAIRRRFQLLTSRASMSSLSSNGSSLPLVGDAEDIFVECGGARLRISFSRTLRVPDDGKSAQATGTHGEVSPLQCCPVPAHAPRIHASKKVAYFLPCNQREAMWISFAYEPLTQEQHQHLEPGKLGPPRAPKSIAIRILSDGVNALTGRVKNLSLELGQTVQDYVVIPGQHWLDGFCVDKDTVCQFVAMPLGAGYSVEAQLSGREFIGGIQLEIIQEKIPEDSRRWLSEIPHDYLSNGEVCERPYDHFQISILGPSYASGKWSQARRRV